MNEKITEFTINGREWKLIKTNHLYEKRKDSDSRRLTNKLSNRIIEKLITRASKTHGIDELSGKLVISFKKNQREKFIYGILIDVEKLKKQFVLISSICEDIELKNKNGKIFFREEQIFLNNITFEELKAQEFEEIKREQKVLKEKNLVSNQVPSKTLNYTPNKNGLKFLDKKKVI